MILPQYKTISGAYGLQLARSNADDVIVVEVDAGDPFSGRFYVDDGILVEVLFLAQTCDMLFSRCWWTDDVDPT